ncbi:hypothetical protein [Sphingomonas sp. SRS2]|uniref:hypothetical protein n=1 Tax=Sphingomonas sp. SRS2 TaxID=133190 RepID=UPI00061847A5|nr:hypothetical protein [Sphingomonas sp. SRS2]KKC25888.1 hypothetical protein WP12_11055 [Sphingomonas sp. SRS2]
MDETPFRRRGNGVMAAATLSACLVCILILQQGRGIWLDEATSFWFTRHDIGLGEIIRERWIADVHPPLFSAYAWVLEPLLGGSVRSMRLVNLGGLLLAALTGVQAWRRGIDRDFLALFAVMVAGSPFFILYAAEFRSYFLQLLFGACLIIQLRMLHAGRASWPMLALTGLLLVNLHYMGSLIGLTLIGAEAIYLAFSGRRRAATGSISILLLALLPLAGALGAMLSVISPVAVNDISALRGLVAIGAVLGSATVPYVAALALLPRATPPRGEDHSFMLVMGGSLAAIAASYALLNLATHNLLSRHMIAAAPIGAAIVALLLKAHAKDNRIGFGLICANALLLAGAATTYGLTHQRWETNLARIESARATCPQGRLYALNPLSLLAPGDKLHSVPAIDEFFGLTYRLIVPDVELLPQGHAITSPGPCPALLWVEHHYARPDASDMELARIPGFAGPIRIRRLQRGDARALLAVYPGR